VSSGVPKALRVKVSVSSSDEIGLTREERIKAAKMANPVKASRVVVGGGARREMEVVEVKGELRLFQRL